MHLTNESGMERTYCGINWCIISSYTIHWGWAHICTPISRTSWWITSSIVSCGLSVMGLGLPSFIGNTTFVLSDCKSACGENTIISMKLYRYLGQILRAYRHTNFFYGVCRTIVHAYVAGESFAQINVTEALRQHHKLSGCYLFWSFDGCRVILNHVREQILGQIFRFGYYHFWCDESGPCQTHHYRSNKTNTFSGKYLTVLIAGRRIQ